MTAPDSVPLWVVSGNPTADELAVVLVVLGAMHTEVHIHRSGHSARDRPVSSCMAPPAPVSPVSWAATGQGANEFDDATRRGCAGSSIKSSVSRLDPRRSHRPTRR